MEEGGRGKERAPKGGGGLERRSKDGERILHQVGKRCRARRHLPEVRAIAWV
jgi:hypothetical protein